MAVMHDGSSRTFITVSRSTDAGRTWTKLCDEVPTAPGENDKPHRFHEPHVAELPDGSLVLMTRYHGIDADGPQNGYGFMRISRSTDGGRTWSVQAKSGLLGLPPHLTTLPDGKLVCVYGSRLADPGYGEFACLSDDGGKTWDVANAICLAPSHCGDLGYPCTAVLPDGTLLTVYYQQARPGEKPCLMATKWRVTR